MNFASPVVLSDLDAMTDSTLDELPFGIVGMLVDGEVTRYNHYEAKLAGLSRQKVVGSNFFVEVAPCTNNFIVAQRLLDEPAIDEIISYVLTVRMRPTRVKMRLLKDQNHPTMYLFIKEE